LAAPKFRAFDIFKEQRRTLLQQRPHGDFGHLQLRIDFDFDTMQLAEGFEVTGEIAEGCKFHQAPYLYLMDSWIDGLLD
jgi:hypothetical protein